MNNQGNSRNDYASPIKVHDLLPLFDRRDALLQERHAVIFGSLIIQDKLTQQTECFYKRVEVRVTLPSVCGKRLRRRGNKILGR